jgi:Ca-activated chloride channel family protein
LLKGIHQTKEQILLIDTSASMGVEDVRPSRFEKALILARHFIKRAVGHQISIVVFSDKSKRIIPFTEDTDLIDARLQSLKSLDLNRGGTALTMAVQESINYFIANNGNKMGNIVVFTDGEEHEQFSMQVPDDISIAMVGIGTNKGGPVPIRDRNGVFRGNKKYNGNQVISKLNESFFKKMKDELENYEYWIASSYSLPTGSIRNFLEARHRAKIEKSKVRIKPVMMEWLMIPGIILLIFSYLFKLGKAFKYTSVILLLFCFETKAQEEKKEPEIKPTPEMIELENKMMSGDMSEMTKKRLVGEYVKSNDKKSAEKLLKEVLNNKDIAEDSKGMHFNLGTLQLENKKIGEAVKTYNDLLKYIEKNPKANKDLKDKVGKNLAKALQMQMQQQQQQKSGESKEKKEGEGESKSGESQGDNQGKQNQQKKQDKEGDGKKDKKEKKKDGKGKDKKKDGKDNEGDKKSDADNKGKKSLNKKKLPSMLKQLISDDNKLQKKMIDKDTKDPRKFDKKDW